MNSPICLIFFGSFDNGSYKSPIQAHPASLFSAAELSSAAELVSPPEVSEPAGAEEQAEASSREAASKIAEIRLVNFSIFLNHPSV